jgi:hypothetical protein
MKGNIAGLMQQAQKMQEQMEKAKRELRDRRGQPEALPPAQSPGARSELRRDGRPAA